MIYAQFSCHRSKEMGSHIPSNEKGQTFIFFCSPFNHHFSIESLSYYNKQVSGEVLKKHLLGFPIIFPLALFSLVPWEAIYFRSYDARGRCDKKRNKILFCGFVPWGFLKRKLSALLVIGCRLNRREPRHKKRNLGRRRRSRNLFLRTANMQIMTKLLDLSSTAFLA